jgi:complex III assembly factor LYRM7
VSFEGVGGSEQKKKIGKKSKNFAMTTTLGLSTYRYMLRAARSVFAGDQHALSETRRELRRQFLENKHLAKDEAKILCDEARDAADFLRKSVVQGVRGADGTVKVEIAKGHTAESSKFEESGSPKLKLATEVTEADFAPPREKKCKSKA